MWNNYRLNRKKAVELRRGNLAIIPIPSVGRERNGRFRKPSWQVGLIDYIQMGISGPGLKIHFQHGFDQIYSMYEDHAFILKDFTFERIDDIEDLECGDLLFNPNGFAYKQARIFRGLKESVNVLNETTVASTSQVSFDFKDGLLKEGSHFFEFKKSIKRYYKVVRS